MTAQDLATAALTTPEALLSWKLPTLDLLIRQCRRANLLPRLAVVLADRGLLERIPPQARAHLRAAAHTPQRQDKAVRRETRQILAALAATGTKLVLLKGAAYVMEGMAAARGRVFADIDLLVPRAALPEVEAALMMHGWMTTHHNAYDQRYYRRWMHELPPLKHALRESVLDVHHAILPETSRLRFSAEPLFEAARPLPGWESLRVLAPADMVLHSAVHLFSGEFEHGLRDLADLDSLLREFASLQFWLDLTARADALGLGRPLYYAMTQLSSCFATPIPREVVEHMERYRPSQAVDALMRAMHARLFRPGSPGRPRTGKTLARQGAFVHAHWLKMPVALLLYHSIYKSAIAPWRRDGSGSL